MANIIWPCRRSAVPAHRLLCNSFRAAMLAGTALGLLGGSAYAETFWTGAVSDDWTDAANWTDGVPDTTGTAVIDTATPNALIVQSGGALSSFSGEIGSNPGAIGAVTVTGASSSWANSEDLLVGGEGSGTLTIEDGGTVTNTTGHIGYEQGSAGIVTVTGAGSSWVNSVHLEVGYQGTGALTIADGGMVSNAIGFLGYLADGDGTVVVTGTGSTWANSNSLYVGLVGTGSLTIADGGSVTSNDGYIGYFDDSAGSVTVSGPGSTWANSGVLQVAGSGTGMLTIANGGAVTNTNGYIGYGADGEGAVTVTGAGSSWANGSDLVVGREGSGTLIISAGGTVINGEGYIGYEAGSDGTVTVTGAGSSWDNSSELNLGLEGAGTLTISAGGAVTNTNGYVGYALGSVGAATVTGAGSSWSSTSHLHVGFEGSGALTIADGGAVASTFGYIGYSAGGEGAVTVTGAGSTLSIGSSLEVGSLGAGTLSIADGGMVTGGDGIIGLGAGSDGTVTVTGVGSTWANSSDLFVGYHGTGALTVADGGTVTNTLGTIGYLAGSESMVTVTGAASSWANSSSLRIGYEGSGTLIISDGGTVTNTNGLIGNIAGSTGTVTVTGAGSTWINSGGLVVASQSDGTLTIADGGAVSTTSLIIADEATSTGLLRIGGATTPMAAGTLNTANVQFGSGAGTLDFNHTDTDYTFASFISGDGQIDHRAGVTKLTGNSSAFSGIANITGGSLYVNGLLGGTVNVNGGTLGGTGGLSGELIINSGGNIAPGNSIGTLDVGNIIFNAGSTYTVELDNGGFVAGTNNDYIVAGGTATINGGTVHVRPENGTDNGTTYTPGTYTILSTVDGVTGTFSGVTDSFLFLGFSLDYDAFNVYLNSFQAAGFTDVAQTPNQMAVAEAVDGMGGGDIFDAIITLTSEEEALAAFDALSGEIHASAQTALVEDSRFLREAVNARVRAAFGEALPGEGLDFWAHGFGANGRWASDGNAAALDRSIGGLFIGGDAALTDEIRLGVVGGYSRSRLDVDDRASSGAASSYHLGLYGGGQWGDFALRGGAAHSWHSIDVNRQVAFTGFADSLSASYKARATQFFGEAGYGFTAGEAKFEPYAGLAHVRLKTDGFAETGGAAALLVENRSAAVTFATLGIRAETDVAIGESEAKLRGGLAWRHAFGNVLPVSTHAFASGSDQFTIAGVPVARNVLAVEAGLDMKLTPAATLGLSYSGQFGSGLSDHAAKASFNMRF